MCVAGLKRAERLGCRGRLNAAFVRSVGGTEGKAKEPIFKIQVLSVFPGFSQKQEISVGHHVHRQ